MDMDTNTSQRSARGNLWRQDLLVALSPQLSCLPLEKRKEALNKAWPAGLGESELHEARDFAFEMAIEGLLWDMIEPLILKGCSPNQPLSHGAALNRVIELWTAEGKADAALLTAQELLRLGASPSPSGKSLWRGRQGSAFKEAFCAGARPIAELFLASGVNPLTQNGALRSVAHEIMSSALSEPLAVEMLSLLLGAGGSADQRDMEGMTPLHEACRHGRAMSARALISAGALVDARDYQGRSPLILSVLYNSGEEAEEEMTALMLNAGANPQERADNGDTPLSLARAIRSDGEGGSRAHAVIQAWMEARELSGHLGAGAREPTAGGGRL